ncbi:hypothetical protein MMC26_003799 [Xylographa opegraphella]|nr:hypothetical protein [Xylographa opegraphella]
MTHLLSIKLLTGAPEASSLQWDSEALTAPLLPCFTRPYAPSGHHPDRRTESQPVWRSLALHHDIRPAGLVQHDEGPPSTTASTAATSVDPTSSFAPSTSSAGASPSPSAAPAAADDDDDDAQTQFYEHSFALHEALPSSQPRSPCSTIATSLASTRSCTRSPSPTPPHIALTPLRTLPTASHIHALHPQTPTVNVLICILSAPPPRTIHPRRGGPALLLTELLVADETRAGVGLNIWLPAKADARSPRLRAAVDALRPRDVVLARNVALGAFRGVVYGQSLRRDMTSLELMYRSGGGGRYSARELAEGGAKEGIVERVWVVRRWVMEFVGEGGGPVGGDRNEGCQTRRVPDALMLPPDTQ